MKKRYILVNPFTAEVVEVDAVAVATEKYLYTFFVYDEERNKIEYAYYSQRNWDIRDIISLKILYTYKLK